MPTVKIIQVFDHYDDEYDATQSDMAQLTDWEEISDRDMIYLREWMAKNSKVYGGPKYAVLMIPKIPVRAFTSVREVIDGYEKIAKAEETRRGAAAEKYQATKMERKRKQLEKLQRELGLPHLDGIDNAS